MWTKREEDSRSFSINSSKVYCKSYWQMKTFYETVVLIVAKCIVNTGLEEKNIILILSINSSKVYCKCSSWRSDKFHQIRINSSKVYCKSILKPFLYFRITVLIVAKCIVNLLFLLSLNSIIFVLIVAKCIVNLYKL